jgi:hypothetical protein
MAIIDSKEVHIGPLGDICFRGWLLHIKNDTDSIFVVGASGAFVTLYGIAFDYAVALGRIGCLRKLVEKRTRMISSLRRRGGLMSGMEINFFEKRRLAIEEKKPETPVFNIVVSFFC